MGRAVVGGMQTIAQRQRLNPNGDFYVAINKSPINSTKSAEESATPFGLLSDHGWEQQDAAYDLVDECGDKLGAYDTDVSDNVRDARSDDAHDAYNAYMEAIHDGLMRGQTSGVVTGIVGPRFWRLIEVTNGWGSDIILH